MRWIARLEEAPARLDGPLPWVAPHAEVADWRLPSPSAADLADAARAKREGGGPRLLRRRMLRALLARVCDVRPDAIAFDRSDAGAPRVEGLAVHMSASGCEGWSAVAIGPLPLGIDIEVGDGPELERWVLREAYAKALGTGVSSLPLDGGGEGVGVPAPSLKQGSRETSPELLRQRRANTPIPALPPSRGKGSACTSWTWCVAQGVVAAVVELVAR